MSLAGAIGLRLLSGGIMAGLIVLAFGTLSKFPPSAGPPPLEKGDKLASPVAAVAPLPHPVSKPIRTVRIYTKTSQATLPAVPEPPPIVIAPVAPIVEPPPAAQQAAPAAKPRSARAFTRAGFARFCRGRGPHSWMRFGGKKRYCK